MRRTISFTAIMSLIATTIACSHPQVRDAEQVDAEEHAELLAGICGDATCSSCPAFLSVEDEGSLAFERVLYGSFSYSTADEALVEVSGCGDGHSVVALERRDDQWHRFGWRPNISLGECEQVKFEDRTTGLVCRTPPARHGRGEDELTQLAVYNGKLKVQSIFRAPGLMSCDDPLLPYQHRIDDWRLASKFEVEYTIGSYCQRARPGQTACEAEKAGIEPVRKASQRQRDLDWSELHGFMIGDFCKRGDILEVLRATVPELEECVSLGGNDAQTGRYISQWKVGLDGGVLEDSSFLHEAPTDDPAVADCFKQVLSQMQFVEPDGGICIINYPHFFLDGNYWKNACAWFDPPPVEWLEQQSQ